MEIFETLMRREITQISNAENGHVAHYWVLTIRANGKDYKAIRVDENRTDRLYVKNFADELVITATFILSDYEFGIVPYKDQLEATLIRRTSSLSQGAINAKIKESIRQYKVQLVDGGTSMSVEGDSPYAQNKGLAAKQSLKTVAIQLINPVIDRIRKQSFGTNFQNTPPMNAIRYILGEVAKGKTDPTNFEIHGVDVVSGHMETPRKHIVLDHISTSLLEAPRKIDEMVGGLYPTGFAYYLQGNHWYCFPPYDVTRFSKARRTVTIIKIPKFRMPGMEKTFRVTQSQVIILTTRETRHADNSEQAQLNDGNGVRFIDARTVMNGYGKKDGNKYDVSMRDNINEIMLEKRNDKSDMVKGSSAGITEKYNKEHEKLAIKAGSVIQTLWEYSNAALIEPGTPVRYLFANGDKVGELFGVIHAVETLSYPTNVNIGSPRFIEMSLITMFVSRVNPIEDKRVDIGSSHTA